jgi:hypothetical protein
MNDVVNPATPGTINLRRVTIMVEQGCNGGCLTNPSVGVRICNGVFDVEIKEGDEFSLPVCPHCNQQTVLAFADPRNQGGSGENWISQQRRLTPAFTTQEPLLALEGQPVVRNEDGDISEVLPNEVALRVPLTCVGSQNIPDRFDR